MQRARWTSVVVAAALALGGCGQNDGTGDASDPSSAPPAVPPPATGLMPPPITPPAPPAPSSAGAGAASADTGGVGGMVAMPSVPTDAGAGGVVGGMGGSGMGAAGSVAPGASPLTIEINARAIPAGGENHVCVVLPLPNTEPAFITSMHATLSAGSHHLIVDRRPAGTTTDSEASPCSPTMGGDSTRLMIAQQRDTTLDMPAGTGLPIAAHQPVFLQLHYINLAETTADIVGTFEVVLSDPAEAPPIEVQSVFAGSTSLDLPNGELSMGEYFMTPGGGSAKPWHVFAVTSHTHSLGIRATIERVASANAADTALIHESLDWHEPPLTRLDPELVFDGSDGLRLRCYYQNDTGHDVRFGTRFEDEMCFLWLYYYEQ
jgi:hypothetical protein